LKRLGWKMLRIWSKEWVEDSASVYEKPCEWDIEKRSPHHLFRTDKKAEWLLWLCFKRKNDADAVQGLSHLKREFKTLRDKEIAQKAASQIHLWW
jgi:hypothetical protein